MFNLGKNVEKLLNKLRKICVFLSTPPNATKTQESTYPQNPQKRTIFYLKKSQYFSIRKHPQITPITSYFFTVSTAPITTKTKEIKKGI